MFESVSRILSVLATASVAVACGGGVDAPPPAGSTTTPLTPACKGATVYTAGIQARGKDGLITVTLDDSNPAPPSVGNNDWTIDVKDAEGKPIAGAKVQFYLWMPAHQHTSARNPIISDNSDGSYDAKDVSFNMSGLWQVTVKVTSADGSMTDSAMFTLCAE